MRLPFALAWEACQSGTQRRRADQLEKENEKLREQLAARAEPRGKLGKSARYEHAIKFADEFDGYDTSDILPIWVGALRHLGERRQVDLRGQLARSKFFKPVVTMVEVQRDIKICTYLKEKVFPAAAFALSRLLINISKRECQLLNQIFKHEGRAPAQWGGVFSARVGGAVSRRPGRGGAASIPLWGCTGRNRRRRSSECQTEVHLTHPN